MDNLSKTISESNVLDSEITFEKVNRIVTKLSKSIPISVNDLIVNTGEIRTTIVKTLKRLSKLNPPLVTIENGTYLLANNEPTGKSSVSTKTKEIKHEKPKTVNQKADMLDLSMPEAVKKIVELLKSRGVQTEENISEETNIPTKTCGKVLTFLLGKNALRVKEMDEEWDDDTMYEYDDELYSNFLSKIKEKQEKAEALDQATSKEKEVDIDKVEVVDKVKDEVKKGRTIKVDLNDSNESNIDNLAEDIYDKIDSNGVKANYLIKSFKGKYSADEIEDALILLVSRGDIFTKNPAAKFKVFLKSSDNKENAPRTANESNSNKYVEVSDAVDTTETVDAKESEVKTKVTEAPKADKLPDSSVTSKAPTVTVNDNTQTKASTVTVNENAQTKGYDNAIIVMLERALSRLEVDIVGLDKFNEVQEIMTQVDRELTKKNNALTHITKAIEILC
jgi:hypothetical protein